MWLVKPIFLLKHRLFLRNECLSSFSVFFLVWRFHRFLFLHFAPYNCKFSASWIRSYTKVLESLKRILNFLGWIMFILPPLLILPNQVALTVFPPCAATMALALFPFMNMFSSPWIFVFLFTAFEVELLDHLVMAPLQLHPSCWAYLRFY